MKTEINELSVNGQVYVLKSSVKETEQAETLDGKPYVIIRGDRSGVQIGYLESQEGREVILLKARRVYCWYGAATLTGLAVQGTSRPSECKFTCEIEKIKILDAIEVIPVTEAAKQTIKSVAIWIA